MEDETPTPEVEQTEPDPKAEYDAKLAELEAQRAEVEKKEKDLSKGFRTIAEREKALQQTAQPTEDDGIYDLDPKGRKTIEAIASEVAAKTEQNVRAEMFGYVAEEFARENNVEVDALVETLQEAGVQPQGNTIADFRRVLQTGNEIMRSKSRDTDAEREAMKQELLEEIAREGIVRLEGSTAKATKPTKGDDPMDESLSPEARIELIKKKNPNLVKKLLER